MFEELKGVSGIYCFENTRNNMMYIGKSVDLKKRLLDHINNLRKNEDECLYLQNAWKKYGEGVFKIYVLEVCPKESISEREIHYIKIMRTKRPFGYNLTDGGDGSSGYIHSEESKLILSQIRKDKYSGVNHPRYGVLLSDETKEKIRKSLTGRKASVETKNKLSESKSGKNHYSFGRKKNNSSKYLGVYFRNNRWAVRIKIDGKSVHVGTYDTEKEAAIAYNEYIIENNLQNFLNEIGE